MFIFGRGRIANKEYKKLQRIAEKHGADFIRTRLAGEGPVYWFAAVNLGCPQDGARERAVMRDLEAAGMIDATGRIITGGMT